MMKLEATEIEDFARRILFGTALADKLTPLALAAPRSAPPAEARDVAPEPPHAPFQRPAFPGRPPSLLGIGNAKFPARHHLHEPAVRGQVLHFFANHELMALELMALVLLRFPEAPPAFRLGLVRTLQEEQTHLGLYLERMHEFGIELGDLPLSDYFWNTLKDVASPLDFVTTMSLTFEQANLDFAVHYRDAIAHHGDERTAAILDRIYHDEIGHVRHGLFWFNRWREHVDQESDWEAYKRLLPPPLTPRRAKGLGFCIEARRVAGFSETFIHELEIHAGSKGRAPVVWTYNPSCDAEIVHGRPGHRASQTADAMAQDLAPLLMVLARDADMIWVRERPRREWLKGLVECGFQVPEFIETLAIREPKLSGFEPWGWSPEVFAAFRPLRERVVARRDGRSLWHRALLEHADFAATGLGPLFSKVWAAEFLRRWLDAHPETHALFGTSGQVGHVATSVDEVRARAEMLWAAGERAILKAPWGTAGNQIRRVAAPADFGPTLSGWVRNTLAAQGGILVEPWLDKLHDLSIQMEVRAGGQVELLGAREFCTDARWQYRGTILGRSFWRLPAPAQRFVHAVLPEWQRLARDVGTALGEAGYQGPAGIDAIVWRTPSGEFRCKPMGELNPRWTMGRVALELERHVVPGVHAAWLIRRRAALDAAAVQARHPARFVDTAGGRRLQCGVFFTTDAESAREVHTLLVAGETALDEAMTPDASPDASAALQREA